MIPSQVFVYGAGGHGKVVADILHALCKNCEIAFVDDDQTLQGATVAGLSVRGNGEWLREEARRRQIAIALGIGENSIRKAVVERCLTWGAELPTLIHPKACVSPRAMLKPGAVVMAGAVINPDAQIGMGAIINTSASIDHDVEIGDFGHVAPNAAMGGAARLGSLSQLGMGSVVIQGVSVGANTIIGAGAVVIRNIPDDVVAFGVPARVRQSR